jgi:phosphoglycerol transferase MdoB-like AlkP superfamily enzyme
MSKGEVQYFLMFVLGIAAFWLSGFVSGLVPVMHNHMLAQVAGLVVTLAVYGLVFVALEAVLLGRDRALKPILVPAIIVVVLAIVAAQLLVKVASGHIHNNVDLGLLTFALYLFYGIFYVIGNTVARRLTK